MLLEYSLEFSKKQIHNNSFGREMNARIKLDDGCYDELMNKLENDQQFLEKIEKQCSVHYIKMQTIKEKDYIKEKILNYGNLKFDDYLQKNLQRLWLEQLPSDCDPEIVDQFRRLVITILIPMSRYLLPVGSVRLVSDDQNKLCFISSYFTIQLMSDSVFLSIDEL